MAPVTGGEMNGGRKHEGDPMHSDSTITFNWFRVNLPTIVTVVGAGIWIINQNNELSRRIAEVEQYRVVRSRETDNNFTRISGEIATISAKMEPITNLQYRTQMLETQMTELAKRMDRVMENVAISMEQIKKDLSMINTRVEVMSGKIDELKNGNDEKGIRPTAFP